MESRVIKGNVALVEKCTTSNVGIKSLFSTIPDDQYKFHLFSNQPAFSQAMLKMSFPAVIFSFSAIRTDRRAELAYLTELTINYPWIRRVMTADDSAGACLIDSLSPLPLDGVVGKASSLTVLQDMLSTALSSPGRGAEGTKNHWYINQSHILNPTEREILRFMSNGYSMPQVAVQFERNIKTIQAHKFNVMSKLGASSDAGLLDTADTLLYLYAGEPTPFIRAVS